jgi:hypothetical protein
MRRALAITIVSLAGALLVIVLACSGDPIIIATIEAGAGHKCEMGDAGDGGEIDPTAPFCSTTTTTCGSKEGFYESGHSPDCEDSGPECGCDGISYYTMCVRQAAHVSRAPGTGPCVPGIKGQSPQPVPAILCQDPACQPKHFGCAVISSVPFTSFATSIAQVDPRVTPDEVAMNCREFMGLTDRVEAGAALFGDAAPPTGSVPGGTCWALPDTCPDSGATRVQRCAGLACIDECEAIRMGGYYFPCEPGGSPN